MSNQVLTATGPLWKPGTRNNVEFLSNWRRLSKEDPITYGLIDQKEGFTCEDTKFEYRVGSNKYGLYCMRKRLTGLENIPNIESDKPPARPPMSDVDAPRASPSAADTNIILMAIGRLTDSINLLALAHVASTSEEKEEIRKKVMAQ